MKHEWLYGRQAVREALRANRRHFFRLLIAVENRPKPVLEEIRELASRASLPVEACRRSDLGWLQGIDQGLALECSPYPYVDLSEILSSAPESGEPACLLVLDQLQDPQNLGTLLRTADAVGVCGVLIPPRRAAGITPAVSNASAGASEHLQVAQANLAQSIPRLKEQGLWVVGLESGAGGQGIEEVDLSTPIALVVGNEAGGLRSLVQKECDRRIRIPMRGHVDSLNAGVAGSLALYAVWHARRMRLERDRQAGAGA
ncbi:MAG: 23S rRNA (guanosine(2251)-2'-O)-methyltransferase RlmB [Anaerolineales bacterium]